MLRHFSFFSPDQHFFSLECKAVLADMLRRYSLCNQFGYILLLIDLGKRCFRISHICRNLIKFLNVDGCEPVTVSDKIKFVIQIRYELANLFPRKIKVFFFDRGTGETKHRECSLQFVVFFIFPYGKSGKYLSTSRIF